MFGTFMAGAAVEHGRAAMTEPTVDVAAEAEKAALVAAEKVVSEKARAESTTAEWGFDPKEIQVTSEDLLRLPTITNWDKLKPLFAEQDKEFDRVAQLSEDPEEWRSPELDRLSQESNAALAMNWDGFETLTPQQQGVAYDSLYNSYAVDTAVERQRLADAVSKTEVKVEHNRITAIYHPKPGEDVVIHEWIPDQSPLQNGVEPMETSFYDRQMTEQFTPGVMYQPGEAYDLMQMSALDSPDKSAWIEQVIVNKIQKELMYADLPLAEEEK